MATQSLSSQKKNVRGKPSTEWRILDTASVADTAVTWFVVVIIGFVVVVIQCMGEVNKRKYNKTPAMSECVCKWWCKSTRPFKH